jgi:hypothetical protein
MSKIGFRLNAALLVVAMLAAPGCLHRDRPPDVPAAPTGPTRGHLDSVYSFVASANDVDGDSVSLQFSCRAGDALPWSAFRPSGGRCTLTESWPDTEALAIRVRARDIHNRTSDWSGAHAFAVGNSAPAIPELSGDNQLETGFDGSFYVSSSDSEDNEVSFQFSWGNGDTSIWLKASIWDPSYETCYVWLSPGTYDVRVRAKDNLGAVSDWSKALSVKVDGPALCWRFLVSDGTLAMPAIAPDGGVVFWCETGDGYYVYCVNPDGSLRWRSSVGYSVYGTPSIDPDGTIYLLDYAGVLHAIARDGRPLWQYSVGPRATYWETWESPAIGPDGTIYAASNYLYALNQDGTLKWRQGAGDSAVNLPCIGPDGTVYAHLKPSSISAVEPSDGSVRWTCALPAGEQVSSVAVGPDGSVYCCALDVDWITRLCSVSRTGSLNWSCPFDSEGDFVSDPVVAQDGTIYAGTVDWFVAVSPDGREQWSTNAIWNGYDQPPNVTADGIIYVVASSWDMGCTLYELNPDGSTKSEFDCDAASSWSVLNGPVTRPDGVAYLALDDKLMALTGSSPLPATGWPCARHDSRHSGWAGGQ